MQTSGVVLDIYDDVGGETLRSMFPTPESLPSLVKEAHALTSSDREKLPDDAFALVLLNGDDKLRKYACIDSGHTALSVLYFLKNAHKLPDEARRVAAENLKTACAWYELDVPEELEKEASIGRAVVNTAKNVKGAVGAGLGVGRSVAGAAMAPAGAALEAARFVKNPMAAAAANPLGTAMTAMTLPSIMKGTSQAVRQGLDRVRAGEAMHGIEGGLAAAGQGIEHLASAGDDELALAFKSAEMSGTSLMPISADHKKTPVESPAVIKKAHFLPPVDVTGKEPTKLATVKTASRYALRDRYPLDNYSQVKLASDYFSQFGRHLTPEDRREFCVNLVKRASELSLDLPEVVRKYGSDKYAGTSEIEMALDTRRQRISDPEDIELLSKVASVRDEVSPELFAEMLSRFDAAVGLSYHYDEHVMDPYYSTFGFSKTAEDEKAEFTDVIGNYYVTADHLKNFARSQRHWIIEVFGNDFCEEFGKDPVGIYKSLPVEQKKLMIRMATENAPV